MKKVEEEKKKKKKEEKVQNQVGKRERRRRQNLAQISPDFFESVKRDGQLNLGALNERQARDDIEVAGYLTNCVKSGDKGLIKSLRRGVQVDCLGIRLEGFEEGLLAGLHPGLRFGVLGLDLLLDIASPGEQSLNGPTGTRKEKKRKGRLLDANKGKEDFSSSLLKDVCELLSHALVHNICVIKSHARLGHLWRDEGSVSVSQQKKTKRKNRRK